MNERQWLPAWLDPGTVPPPVTLDAALPGLTRAQSLHPLQRLQQLQASGLGECGAAGEPVHIAWRQFLRGHGPSVLVIDATDRDPRAHGSAAVLAAAPWLLDRLGVVLGTRWPGAAELALIGAVITTGLVASLIPGWRAWRMSLADGLTPKL